MALSIEELKEKGRLLRIHSIRATTEAGSGHPSSCLSAADLASVIFFREMRFDPRDAGNAANDRFILSKGHAAPLLWAAVGIQAAWLFGAREDLALGPAAALALWRLLEEFPKRSAV